MSAPLTQTEAYRIWEDEQARRDASFGGVQDGGAVRASANPVEDLERDIAAANRDADNAPIDQKAGVEAARRYHNAKTAYQEAMRTAGNDQDKVDPAILREYARADAANLEWINAAEAAEAANRAKDDARTLAGLAENEEAVKQKILRQALETRREWQTGVLDRGEVREHKPPICVPADRFDAITIDVPIGDGVMSGAMSKRGVAKQQIIYAPEPFHREITKYLASPAFWQNMDGGLVRQTMRDAGGDYHEFARRAAASTDAGAWAGTQEWGQFWNLIGGKTFFFDTSVVPSIDTDMTDKIPLGAITAAPAGGWVGENQALTLDDMETKTEDLDAFLYAVASDISDKYARNSWAQRLNFRGNTMRQQASKAAYDIGVHFVNGAAVANVAPAGLNAKIGAANRNKLSGIVKATDIRAADLIEATYSVDREYRRGGIGLDRACFFGSSDIWKAIETESGTDRRINTEGQPWLQSMITYPQMTPFAEAAHVNFFLRQFACIESEGFEAPATGKTTALWFGTIGEAVIVRRSSLFSAVVPVNVMIGGQAKVQERLAHWIYTDIQYVQDTTLSGKAGPLTVIQPNRS